MKILQAKEEHLEELEEMMEAVISETYSEESDRLRAVLRKNFAGESLKEIIYDKQALLYIVEKDEKIAAFTLGWLFRGVFTIYWIYTKKEYRGKSIVKELLNFVENKLTEFDCYKIEMYAYAANKLFIEGCGKLGFSKGVLIDHNMFGVKIQNLYKYIGEKKDEGKEKKIKIVGEAGQGIKLLSFTLASVLSHLGNEVSLNLEYDSAVRGGMISSDLIFSDKKIENPIIDEADLLIKFTKTKKVYPAKAVVLDEGICDNLCINCTMNCKQVTKYGFVNEAQTKFGSKMFINMVALGRILKYMGINIMLLNMEELLPPKLVEQNISAIKWGYNYKE